MATLIAQILELAASSETPIADLLSRATILATRLGDSDFRAFLDLEMNGYSDESVAPDYRKIENPQLFGDFFGIAGMQLRNSLISTASMPAWLQEKVGPLYLRQSCNAYELLLGEAKEIGFVQSAWPAELFGYIEQFENMNCLFAAYRIPTSKIASLLQTVRSKILNYTLTLEQSNPQAGDAVGQRVPGEVMHQAFVNHISNSTIGNLAQGGTTINQTATIGIIPGQIDGLKAALKTQGVPDLSLIELERAIEADPPTLSDKGFGPRVREWISKTIAEVPVKLAADVVVQGIFQFYGHHLG